MPTAGGEGAVGEAYAAIGALAWSADSTRWRSSRPRRTIRRRRGSRTMPRAGRGTSAGFLSRATTAACSTARACTSSGRARRRRREAVQITHGDFDVSTPAWSPDGTQLAFAAEIDAPEWAFYSDIFVVGRDGGALRRLTASKGRCRRPRSPATERSSRGSDTSTATTRAAASTGTSGRACGGGAIRSLSARLGRSAGDWITSDARGLRRRDRRDVERRRPRTLRPDIRRRPLLRRRVRGRRFEVGVRSSRASATSAVSR